MTDNKDSALDFYDIIFYIDSFADLKDKGWKLSRTEDGVSKYNFYSNKDSENKDEEKDNKEKKEVNRIGILGSSGVGKTFVLGKLINKEIKEDFKTKGISIIYPEINSNNLFVCLDSQGSEEPILDKKSSIKQIFNFTDEEKKIIIQDSLRDKKCTEIFIQDFIIENSNIFILVVDQLTFSEQKLINRLMSKNFDKIFIIHNTQFFTEIETIEEYIDDVVKKSLFSNLEKITVNVKDDKENNNKENNNNKDELYFFKEKGIGKGEEIKRNKGQEVLHLFMGKDGTNAGNYFNKNTIKYIKYLIKSETKKKIFDIEEEVKNFLSFHSQKYILHQGEEPIKKEDLSFEIVDDCKYLQCKNKNFKIKNIVTNEMGVSNFLMENSINAPYICYLGKYQKKKKNSKDEIEEEWDALVIETEMFVEAKNIKITKKTDSKGTIKITIIAKKEKIEDPNIMKEIDSMEGGDIKYGNIIVDILINIENVMLASDRKPVIKENGPGKKIIYFKLGDDNNNESSNVEIIKNKSSKTKK